MEYSYKQTGLQAATALLPLSLLKQYLRVTHSNEDDKITDYIKAAIGEFEKQTGYLLRSGTVELKFNFEDRIDYEKRHDYSYVDVWDDKSSSMEKSFYPPLSGEFESQAPSAMSFYTADRATPKLVTLSAAELAMLPSDFFLVYQKRTLNYVLKMDDPDASKLLRGKNYSPYSRLPTIIEVAISSRAIPDDVKQACIRIASMLYEYPDQSVKYLEDDLIKSAISFYNSSIGL